MPPEPRTPLEQILFFARVGASRDEVRAWWPPDTDWTDKERELLCRTAGTGPFTSVAYVFMAEKLYNMKLVTVRPGEYDAFEELEREVFAQLPSITAWTEVSSPWSTAAARPRLEGKGNERTMMAVMLGGSVPGSGRISGKGLAFRRNERQHYGFELFWFPTA